MNSNNFSIGKQSPLLTSSSDFLGEEQHLQNYSKKGEIKGKNAFILALKKDIFSWLGQTKI